MSRWLAHHGIKGQKWGIRNGPPYPLESDDNFGRSLLKKAYSSNLDSWGKSRNRNTLYITSYSGSGKSTLALYLSKLTGADVIHLDGYINGENTPKSKGFDRYLEQNRVNPRDFVSFEKALDDYSKVIYPKKKLIVEGVQLLDETLYPDKRYFSDKPVLIPSTSAKTASERTSKRDNTKVDSSSYNFTKSATKRIRDISKATRNNRQTNLYF